jgi:DNA polymerase III subunit gamma/tau
MSLALYRKYRPKTFDELVGQENIVEVLRNAARQDRFGHAYLFYGSRGTGKTTTARLIAKLLNCETRHKDAKFKAKGEPCNECRSCEEIDSGYSMDVIEIDAASNRGIEEIRNLKENIKAAPSGSHYKVYIIDEAHMLTGPAFNALLKTLEEPPAHAVFVLATTEYEKLPPTITSRTQRFLFRKVPKVKIAEKLKEIAATEKMSADDAALELVAAAAEGSLRDAESILDQVASAGGKITLAAVEELTGRVGFRKVDELAHFILKKDLPAALAHLAALSEEGHNLVQLTRDLIHYIRKVLTLKTSPDIESTLSLELTQEEIARVKELGALLSPEDGVRYLRAMIRAYSEMRYSPFATIPLEVALIEQLGK